MEQKKEFTLFKEFSINPTTKEQYLKFKEELKSNKYHCHAFYIAYYMFKHRLVVDYKSEEIGDPEKYLDDVVIPACKKGLYKATIYDRHGEVYPGQDCYNYSVRQLKEDIRGYYNQYADPEQYYEWKHANDKYYK